MKSFVKESVYKRDQCGICGSSEVQAKSIRADQTEAFLSGQPVAFVTRHDPNVVRVLFCDECKAVLHNNRWITKEMESRALKVVTRLLEADEPPPGDELDPREEIDRLLPTKSYRLRGNSMIHAPGVINMAQMRWRERSKKAKQHGMEIIKSWQGLPEQVYLDILNGNVEIQTEGDDAVITIKQY